MKFGNLLGFLLLVIPIRISGQLPLLTKGTFNENESKLNCKSHTYINLIVRIYEYRTLYYQSYTITIEK